MANLIRLPEVKAPQPTKYLHKSDSFVTASDGTASTLVWIWKWLIARGRAVLIPGQFPLRMHLRSAVTTELPDDSSFCLGVFTREDAIRAVKVGEMPIYAPWADLTSDNDQADDRINHDLWFDLGGVVLAVSEGETLGLGVYSSAVADETYCTVRIPVAEMTPQAIQNELAYRKGVWGW